MDKKINDLLNKLSGEQVGKLLSMYYKDSFVREIAFYYLVGCNEDENEKKETYEILKGIARRISE